jgi:Ca2+-binding EF-hand superfamily protein
MSKDSGVEFLRNKWRRMAWVLDIDRDGLVSKKDYAELADRTIEVGGLDPNSRQARQIRRKLLQTFDDLLGHINHGNPVTYDQVVGAFEGNLEELKRLAYLDWPFLFDVVDFNADGVIQKEEFRKFFYMFNLNASHADKVFDRIDLNGDGSLDMKEFMTYANGFLFITDESHPSRHFFP